MSSSVSITDFADAIRDLTGSLRAFSHAVATPGAVLRGVLYDSFDGQVLPTEDLSLQLDAAVTQIDCSDDMENGSVLRFPGCFEVHARVIAVAAALNASKQRFEDCVKALEKSGYKPHQVRELYRAQGHVRIHPLQAWRQLKIFEQPELESIGFTIAKRVESIEVMDVEVAMSRLLSSGRADDAAEELKEWVGESDTQVHWHSPVANHLRANVAWREDGLRQTTMAYASLPFLVPEGAWPSKRVRFNTPRAEKKKTRADRKRVTTIPISYYCTGAYLSVIKKALTD